MADGTVTKEQDMNWNNFEDAPTEEIRQYLRQLDEIASVFEGDEDDMPSWRVAVLHEGDGAGEDATLEALAAVPVPPGVVVTSWRAEGTETALDIELLPG